MIDFINIADLKDPKDPKGSSYRQVNAEKDHKFKIGTLVELDNGCRLFVVKHTRDCDMTPLYSLAPDLEDLENNFMFGWSHGYGEDYMKMVNEDE